MLLLLSLAHAAPAALPYDELKARVDAEFSFAHEVAHADGELPGTCLTEVVNRLRLQWNDLTPDQRAEMTALLAPGPVGLFDSPASSSREAPPPEATDSCAGQQKDNRLPGDHFVVEWDDGVIDERDAQNFLDALEYAYGVEVDELGWLPPGGDGRYLMPAYVQTGNYASAYTTVRACGGVYTPYIVAYAGSFRAGNWYETMALHEFNHSLQFSYSFAPEFYWWEATATYVEELVLPDSNWWSTYVVGYSQNPQMAMSAFSQSDQDIFYHMYGMSIFGFYLDEYQGGNDIVRQTWESAIGERGQYDLDMETMTTEIGLDWDALYAEFTAVNTVMDYREQRYFTDVDEYAQVDDLPADGKSTSRDAPQGYGQHFIRFSGDAGDGESTLTVHFHGDDGVEWLAQLVEMNNQTVNRTSRGEIVDGEGDVTLEAFGGKDVMLIVSPLKDRDDEYDYSWEAELTAADPPEEEDTAGDDTGGVAENPEGKSGSLTACGCASAGSPELVGVGALLAGIAALRRRR